MQSEQAHKGLAEEAMKACEAERARKAKKAAQKALEAKEEAQLEAAKILAAAPPPWETFHTKYGLCCSAVHRTGEDGVSRLLYKAGQPTRNKEKIRQMIEQVEEQGHCDDLFA